MTHFANPVLRGFNPDPSIVRVDDDFYIATSTFEWFPGVQIHHSRDLVHWRTIARPLRRASQLDMRGDPDSCGVWAPDLTYAHGKFWLMFTDVKRYGQTTVNGATGASLRDFHNYLVTADSIDGEWSDPVHLNSSGFDPSLFHDDDGRTWLVNMMWDHRPGSSRFGGIVIQELDRATKRLVGKRHLVFAGAERGFTEAPHIYKRDGWYHLMVAEGGTGWEHAVVMARSLDLLGPYEVHPDGAVLTAAGKRDGALTRAGHGDLVDLPDGSTWIAYLCGRPLPRQERCVLGRETAIQRMVWCEDGWLRTLAGDAAPEPTPALPNLPAAPDIADPAWDGAFHEGHLPLPLQWLRSPVPERLFSLSARPGWLRLYGRETVGSFFEQALVARRQEHFAFTASTLVAFDPQDFQQSAGLICYYNSTKFHYLNLTMEGDRRQLQVLSAVPGEETVAFVVVDALPEGEIELRVDVVGAELRFSWRCGETDWSEWPVVLDASALSDEVSLPGLPNFTGSFVGMAAQDLSGDGAHADFRFFRYEGLASG